MHHALCVGAHGFAEFVLEKVLESRRQLQNSIIM